MVVARGSEIVAAPLSTTVGKTKPVDPALPRRRPGLLRLSRRDSSGGLACASRDAERSSEPGVTAASLALGIGRVRRLGRLGEAGVVVDGERLGLQLAAAVGPRAVLAVDPEAHRAHAVELAGREHDLGDGQRQLRRRSSVEDLLGDVDAAASPADEPAPSSSERRRDRRAAGRRSSSCVVGPLNSS